MFPRALPRFQIGLAELTVVLGALTLVLFQLNQFAADPGLGGHLATGAYVLETGTVPRTDPFLVGATPRLWVADQWLGGVVLFKILQATSWPVLYGALTALYIVSFFVFLHRTATLASGSVLSASVATLICLKLSCVHFIARPVLLSLCLLVLLGWILAEVRASIARGGATFWWSILVLPPLFLLWALVHPYVVVGLALFGAFLLALAGDFLLLRGVTVEPRRGVVLFLAFCCSAGATLLNPYGAALYAKIVGLGQSPLYRTLLQEWQPLAWDSIEMVIVFFMVFTISLSLLVREARGPRIGIHELLILPAALWFALTSARGIAVFTVLAAPSLAVALRNIAASPLLASLPMLGLTRRISAACEERELLGARGYLLATAIAVGLLLFTLWFDRLPLYRGDYGPPRSFPYGAVQYLRERGSPEHPVQILNPVDWGGFIVWAGAGRVRPVIDDRLTLRPEEEFRSYLVNFRGDGNWLELVHRYGVSYLLVPRSGDFAASIQASRLAELLYEDSVAVVFRLEECREGGRSELKEEHERAGR